VFTDLAWLGFYVLAIGAVLWYALTRLASGIGPGGDSGA
jgi:hypothetical protein